MPLDLDQSPLLPATTTPSRNPNMDQITEFSAVAEVVIDMQRLMQGCRDYATENLCIDIAKAELYLISTLSTARVKRWLPGATKTGDYLIVGSWAVCVRTTTNCPPGIDRQRLPNDLQSPIPLPNHFYMGLVYDRSTSQPVMTYSGAPLFEFYCIMTGLSYGQGLAALRDDCDLRWRSLADLPKIDGRVGFASTPVGRNNPNEIPVPVLALQGPGGFIPVRTIDFLDDAGRVAMQVMRFVDVHGNWMVLPVSRWRREGDFARRMLFVPPMGKLPLLHADLMRRQAVETVLIVDSPELASDIQASLNVKFGGSPFLPTSRAICTSWWGGAETVSAVDWSPLKAARAQYLILPHSGQSWEEAFKTAQTVFRHLAAQGINVEVIDCWNGMHGSPLADEPGGTRARNPSQWVMQAVAPAFLSQASIATGSVAPARTERDALFTLADGPVPEPNYLFAPFVAEGTTTLLYAKAGLGKTWTAIYIAYALAAGQRAFGRWSPPRPGAVLYVDGEMGQERMQRRLATVAKLFPESCHEVARRNLGCISVGKDSLDISTEADQERIESELARLSARTGQDVALVVLDNLQALLTSSPSTSAWKAVSGWLRELNDRGIAVLVLHHPNKQGNMLGPEAIRNSMDGVILLESEDDDDEIPVAQDSISYRMTWDKARDLRPADRHPIFVKLDPDEDRPLLECWTSGDGSTNDIDAKIIQMCREGKMTNQEMADAVGMPLETFKKRKAALGLTRKRCSKKK